MNKIILFLFPFFCCSQIGNYHRIVIEYVDFDIFTPFRISCDAFHDYFRESIVKKEVPINSDLNEIHSIIKNLQVDTSIRKLDIRLKMYLYTESKVDTICMSKFGLTYNSNSMQKSDELLIFIEKIKNSK